MFIRMWPGILITLALAVYFFLASGSPSKRAQAESNGKPKVREPRSVIHREEAFPPVQLDNFRYHAGGSSVRGTPSAPAGNINPPADWQSRPATRVSPEKASQPNGQPLFLPLPDEPRGTPPATVAGTPLRRWEPAAGNTSTMAAPAKGENTSKANGLPGTEVKNITIGQRPLSGNRAASTVALASLGDECGSCGVTGYPAQNRSELPDKGIYLYASGQAYREKQQPHRDGVTAYKNHGEIYSVGVIHDWSVDTDIGLRFDYLDADVENLDTRDQQLKNKVRGYMVHAEFDSFLFEKYPIKGKAFYGRIDNQGEGYIHDQRGVTRLDWGEDRHRSHIYGGSLKVGIPLIGGNNIKYLPELGVEHTRIKTKRYDIRMTDDLGGVHSTTMGPKTSWLTSVPLSITVKRDFPQCWGVFTPRLSGGYAWDFGRRVAGVRTFNSSATWENKYAIGGEEVDALYDDHEKGRVLFGAGVDIHTVGGWQLAADYTRQWASKYHNDIFRLELGRCF